MNLQQFFNLVLLALSVATILLTIISYLMYRVRQMPGIAAKPAEVIRTQGVFFRRYLPKELADANQVSRGEARPRTFAFKVVPFFGISACTIFIALFVSMMVGGPAKVASVQAGGLKELRAKGLLKDYDLAQTDLSHVTEESITHEQAQQVSELMAALKTKKIQLVDFNFVPAPELKKLPAKKETSGEEKIVEENAAVGWRTFMTAHQFNFEVVNKIDCASRPDLVLIPQAQVLTEAQKSAITACAEQKVSILATGPIGVGGASGADSLSEKVFGLRFTATGTQNNEPTTVFRDGKQPLWDLPAGLILNWAMLDGNYKATLARGEGSAYETLGNGFATPYVRAAFLDENGGRRAWLAFDPSKEKSVSVADRFYRRMALASAMAWAARVPRARVESWPAGHAAALLVSVDSEDKFENVAALQKGFESVKAPATFFLVSNLFAMHAEAFKKANHVELASHSENHSIFAGQPLAEQFERIQNSRHEIEEIGAERVRGFRAPEERYDDATIGAVVQNHLDFFAVDRRFPRYSPISIDKGVTLLFPRLTIDDFGLERRGDLKTADAFANAIVEDAEQVLKVGGMNLLNTHTQLTGANTEMLEGVKKAIATLQARDFWLATYSQTTAWWRARQQVELHVQPGSNRGSYTVQVANVGSESLDDVVVDLDLGVSASATDIRITEQTTVPNRQIAQAQKSSDKIQVGTLHPNESRVFVIDSGAH